MARPLSVSWSKNSPRPSLDSPIVGWLRVPLLLLEKLRLHESTVCTQGGNSGGIYNRLGLVRTAFPSRTQHYTSAKGLGKALKSSEIGRASRHNATEGVFCCILLAKDNFVRDIENASPTWLFLKTEKSRFERPGPITKRVL